MAAALLVATVAGCSGARKPEAGGGAAVARGPFSVWSAYDGKLEARRVEVIMSRFSGSAAIAELAPEGSRPKPGDLLVRFDDAQVRNEVVKLKRDLALAKSEMESLQFAKLPIEIRDLELQHLEAKAALEAEKRFLEDSVKLAQEDLVSAQEIEQQKLKVDQAQAKLDKIALETKLTKEYLGPSRLERAGATLQAAQEALSIALAQLSNCVVRAPSDGMVIHRPLHIGTEYRTARVGDTIYMNQPFMSIADMSDLQVECYVPEAELSLVSVGKEAVVTPLAYPNLPLKAQVESVGSMAQAKPGRGEWQKYFAVTLAVKKSDERLRSGMSVRARILAYQKPDALLVPRSAVQWEDDRAVCTVLKAGGREVREVKLGRGNAKHFEVLEGLSAGEVVAP